MRIARGDTRGMTRSRKLRTLLRAATLGLLAAGSGVGALRAQDSNILLPTDSLEYLMGWASFELPDTLQDMRFEGDRTQRVPLFFADGTGFIVKWARAPQGGERFNNNPRYEIAPYELQKLFLDPPDYVVPPTVPRALPLSWYRTLDRDARATFGGTESVLVVLQYFLFSVRDGEVLDEDRFEADSVYARHWGDLNLLTYLIHHNDSNNGNVLISTDPGNPRVFAVDNGLAFESEDSNRGTRWRALQVDRFPAATVERLRALTEEDLTRQLGVLVQFEIRDGHLVRVEPGENLNHDRGVRESDGIIQLGLTRREIRGVWRRLEDFLETVDRGRVDVF